jgi:hypothetical protein
VTGLTNVDADLIGRRSVERDSWDDLTTTGGIYQTANWGLRRPMPLLGGSPRAPPLMDRTRPRGRELGSSDLPAGGVEGPLTQYAPFVFQYLLVCHRGAGTARHIVD